MANYSIPGRESDAGPDERAAHCEDFSLAQCLEEASEELSDAKRLASGVRHKDADIVIRAQIASVRDWLELAEGRLL